MCLEGSTDVTERTEKYSEEVVALSLVGQRRILPRPLRFELFPLLQKVRGKSFRYLFGDAVPLLVADAQVLALLVEELALLGDQEHVAHKFAHCNGKKT